MALRAGILLAALAAAPAFCAPARLAERPSEAIAAVRAAPGLEALPDLAIAKLALDLSPHFEAPGAAYEVAVDASAGVVRLRSPQASVSVSFYRRETEIAFGSPREESAARRLAERLRNGGDAELDSAAAEFFDGDAPRAPAAAPALGFRTQEELRAFISQTVRAALAADEAAARVESLLRAARYSEAVEALGDAQRTLPVSMHPTVGRVLLYELPRTLANLRRLPPDRPAARDLPYWNRLARNVSSSRRRTFDGVLPGGRLLELDDAFVIAHEPAARSFLTSGLGHELTAARARRDWRRRALFYNAARAAQGALLFIGAPAVASRVMTGAWPVWPALLVALLVAAAFVWTRYPWGRVSGRALIETALEHGWLPEDPR